MARVLIVEDIKIMSFTIEKFLNNLGHEVVAQASNGYDAIEQYKIYKPDIVTMDITMPAKNDITDGIEALKVIKKIDPNANIIMLTSHGENKLVMKAIANGAKGYILKPVTKESIKESIEKIILQ